MDAFLPKYWWAITDKEIEKFKEFLGPGVANQFTDAELRQLWRELWDWANFLLELYESGFRLDPDSDKGEKQAA